MATNTVTSVTGSVAAGVVTFNVQNIQKKAYLYVRYNDGDGTSVAMTIGSINPLIHATEAYEHTELATATVAPITVTFNTAKNHRFEINMSPGEKTLKVTFVFTGGTTQAVVCDIYPE